MSITMKAEPVIICYEFTYDGVTYGFKEKEDALDTLQQIHRQYGARPRIKAVHKKVY